MSSHYILQIAYTRGDVLGTGAFGTVYKAHVENDQRTYAVKDIKCSKNEDLDSAVDEIRALGKLIHENIIKLYNVRTTQTARFHATLSLLLEYCDGGNLNTRLNEPSSLKRNFSWMQQIIAAVEYLHDNDTIHRDLKPQNVLLSSAEVVKLADFGLATRFARKNDSQSWYSYYIELGVGAACYIAPEVLLERYTYKADIFSVGVIFYAILERSFQVVNNEKFFGVFVNDGKSQQPLGVLMFNRSNDVPLEFSRTRSPAVVEMLKRTLKFDYKERPTAQEIRVTLQQNLLTQCTIS